MRKKTNLTRLRPESSHARYLSGRVLTRLITIIGSLVLLIQTSYTDPVANLHPPDDQQLADLLSQAYANHPRLRVTAARAEQARARYEREYGFFDPRIFAGAGAAGESRTIPGAAELGNIDSETTQLEGGLRVPFRPGLYFHLGASERYHHGSSDADGDDKTLFGMGVRIPLLKDRGFASWNLRKQQMLADWDRAASEHLAEKQSLRREIELAYTELCRNLLRRQIRENAAERSQLLLEQTEELAVHNEIADYQIHAARLETELSRTEALAATGEVENLQLRLTELTAAEKIPDLTVELDQWLRQSEELQLPEWREKNRPYQGRGDYLKLVNSQLMAEFGLKEQQEQKRGDLSLRAGATWSDRERSGHGDSRRSEDDKWGGHVTLMYERVLGQRAEKAEIEQYRQRLAELEARLDYKRLRIKQSYKQSRAAYLNAASRLRKSQKAVEAARRNLTAENERFRLGEARSRDVLDAQNDVTRAELRQIEAAADVRSAFSEAFHSLGYLKSNKPEDH